MMSLCILGLVLQSSPIDKPELTELLPGLRLADGIVEFQGAISIDAHHPETPDVYLEMFVTAPDSREHESLVVSKIRGSNLHAALLAAGFESGSPISRDRDEKTEMATGDELLVLVAIDTDNPQFVPMTEWVAHIDLATKITSSVSWGGFVFSGSSLTAKGYTADATGTLISLTTFGDEVISPAWSLSHEATIDEPVWIANRDLLPAKGTKVIVRLERHPESHEPDGVHIDGDP